MLDLEHLPSDKGISDVQVFVAPRSLTNLDWETWRKPRGIGMVNILCIGGGGGGGAGFQAAAAAARGGGGGGSSGGMSTLTIPAMFLPNILYIQAGAGGLGSKTGAGDQTSGQISRIVVETTPALIEQNTLLLSSGGVATFGNTGTGAAAGAGGTAATVATLSIMNLAGAGTCNFIAGQAGTAGGAQTGAVGAAQTLPTTSVRVMGGVGGAGVTAADFAGGSITAVTSSWLSENRPANAAAGTNNGSGGFTLWKPFFSFPGMGGGSSNAGAGGHGGNGSYGSGGGGGGGGVTRGQGGDGGSGIVIITSW